MSALHRAIEREKYEIVEILLSHPNIDVDAKMTDINNGIQKKNFNQIWIFIYEKSILEFATENRNIRIIELLLSHPKIDLNEKIVQKIKFSIMLWLYFFIIFQI